MSSTLSTLFSKHTIYAFIGVYININSNEKTIWISYGATKSYIPNKN